MKLIKNNKTHLVFPRELLETIDKLLGKRNGKIGTVLFFSIAPLSENGDISVF